MVCIASTPQLDRPGKTHFYHRKRTTRNMSKTGQPQDFSILPRVTESLKQKPFCGENQWNLPAKKDLMKNH